MVWANGCGCTPSSLFPRLVADTQTHLGSAGSRCLTGMCVRQCLAGSVRPHTPHLNMPPPPPPGSTAQTPEHARQAHRLEQKRQRAPHPTLEHAPHHQAPHPHLNMPARPSVLNRNASVPVMPIDSVCPVWQYGV
eukprot:365023-Chlamydomonas_euryale.AAC.17